MEEVKKEVGEIIDRLQVPDVYEFIYGDLTPEEIADKMLTD